jgi:catechol 2,3-dioxygenase-like lactoylglutathione lyase family enzyme
MRFVDRYPIIVTPRLRECRDFWTAHLGFAVAFEADWFILLQAQGASLAFMSPDHPSAPPGPEAFSGKGMCFELQVDDAAAAYEECRAAGLEPDYALAEEDFGQLRFGFFDPAGLWVDVVEQVEPAEGYWDRYMSAAG